MNQNIISQGEVTLGGYIDSYTYEEISVFDHYLRIALANLLVLFLFFGGWLWRDAPWDWLGVMAAVFIYTNIHWWNRLKRENNFATLSAYENGLEISNNGDKEYVLWNDIKDVIYVDSTDERTNYCPGMMLDFGNENGCMIYQRIIGYESLFKLLKSKGVIKDDEKLPLYEPTNVYGQPKESDNPTRFIC